MAMQLLRGERRSERGQRGQVLVIFTLAAVAIIGVVGLVIDGGMTFVQRRDQQNVADAAAMAGGYAYLNSTPMYDAPTAQAAAIANAAANGYVNGVNSTVTVNVSGVNIVVNITRPHTNFFAGMLGMPQWNVSTTATTEAGVPNAAVGVMPILFNQKALAGASNNEVVFDEPPSGSADIPQDATTFNWTVFCVASGSTCNADSNTVNALVDTRNSNPQDVTIDMTIAPLNAGSHATLYSTLSAYVGTAFPVAIVDDSGNFLGLAYFHLTAVQGGSLKEIRGYFETPVNATAFHITPGVGAGYSAFGAYVVKLTN